MIDVFRVRSWFRRSALGAFALLLACSEGLVTLGSGPIEEQPDCNANGTCLVPVDAHVSDTGRVLSDAGDAREADAPPATPALLYAGLSNVQRLFVTNGDVFVTERETTYYAPDGGSASPGLSQLLRFSSSQGFSRERIDSRQENTEVAIYGNRLVLSTTSNVYLFSTQAQPIDPVKLIPDVLSTAKVVDTSQVAIDQTNVYLTREDDSTHVSLFASPYSPFSFSPVSTLAVSSAGKTVVASGGTLFVAVDGGIRAIDATTRIERTVTTNANVPFGRLVALGSDLLWPDNDTLYAVGQAGANPYGVATFPGSTIVGLAAAQAHMAVLTQSGSTRSLVQIDRAKSSSTTLVSGLSLLAFLAVDDVYAYWVDGTPGRLYRIPLE